MRGGERTRRTTIAPANPFSTKNSCERRTPRRSSPHVARGPSASRMEHTERSLLHGDHHCTQRGICGERTEAEIEVEFSGGKRSAVEFFALKPEPRTKQVVWAESAVVPCIERGGKQLELPPGVPYFKSQQNNSLPHQPRNYMKPIKEALCYDLKRRTTVLVPSAGSTVRG